MSRELSQHAIDITAFQAGVFDLDGVVTRTATVHSAAWKQLFDDYLSERASRAGDTFQPFDEASDYLTYVDGKPRYAGVASFLQSRGISLPQGSPEDAPQRETICGLGNRKNQLVGKLLAQGKVEVFASTVTLLERLREAGVKTALVSSSENAAAVLEAAGLSHLFDVRVDGIESRRLGLKGKPDPDIFLEAASQLGVAPAHAFAVEDAISGVASAYAAGYGLVIGVDRVGQRDALLEQGADLVVEDLAPLERHDEATLPDALEHFAAIARRLESARPAVFLDYDGTLTPIVDRPELAVLDEAVRDTIRRLAERCTVAIVSGRDRADVERLVGLDELIYAGSHGFDIAGPDGLHKHHERAEAFLAELDSAEAQLQARLDGVEGALVERKRFAIAVHYRLVAEADRPAVEAALQAVAEVSPGLRRTGGKMIFELRPRIEWDKGRAVSWLLEVLELLGDGVMPIYLGDDETDEDAFRALRERGGIGILITREEQPTAAHYRLETPAAAGRLLQALAITQEAQS
ncbi:MULTISPECIES: trehalose-phosphatase [Halomonadaceae]|uniref:trehalose-phosphatase n=1 Tax=Halomonadaceae TaxID=28256 RepID=UPI001598FDC5|nr:MULTISPECIES: trehalose-phosphatase [Halomonas]QJQ95242.1 trehalose-phosphatase [Halomonas sp. PA5]